MANRTTMNISLSPEHKAFVKRQVASGRYRNDSEVVRQGLRLLEDLERRRQLEEKLLQGLDRNGDIAADDAFWNGLRERLSASSPRGDRSS